MKILSLFFLGLFWSGLAWGAEPGSGNKTARIAWNFQIKDDGNIPRGKVYLRVNGGDHLVISDAAANYQKLEKNEYQDYSVPRTAVLAAYSWHAGFGDILFVTQKNGTLEIFRREMDEAEDSKYPLKKIRVIPL